MIENETTINREEVAIIGMAGRFPDAENIDEFWQNLCSGVLSIKSFTNDELIAAGTDVSTLQNPSFVNKGAVIKNADCFDASFFGYSPIEAEIIDPQHRLLLECAWETLEDAGYNSDSYNGSIGVFGGVSPNTYFQNNLITRPDILKKVGPQLMRLSNEKDHVTTRISFKLNLRGPAISVNTACSSSGVALHLAYQSILSGECDMALVGGARIESPLKAGYLYEEGGILSPDGQCRVFDAKARGTVFGNGVCMILVKRLSDAVRDGDTIHAIVKGTAINNDGSQKVGYGAPSIQGQARVIEEALTMAEVDPETIGYLEAHGTGTSLGDPIEITALTRAFQRFTDKKGYCPIGSVKSNIGHLFAGAGVTGIIKTVLALKYKLIPPSLGFEIANPQIDFENSPFYVNNTLTEWKSQGIPRRAGVSSFGIGGTNAHIILEEAPQTSPSGPSRADQLLLLSAKSETALNNATVNIIDYMKQHPDINLADVAYTLHVGRKTFSHHRMLVCNSLSDAITALEANDPERVVTYSQKPEKRDVVFMFSGQGSQYVNMGLDLYGSEPTYKKQIDRCSEILKPHLGLDLRNVMFSSGDDMNNAANQLKNTLITQPALFTLEYALAQLWMYWGIQPSALVGHSIGEYVAACLAGVFSLEEALFLVAGRGRLMQELPGGSMLAVPLSEKEIMSFLHERVSLAAINGPSLCVLSGETDVIRDLEKELSQRNIHCRFLHTSHAFHSEMMEPIFNSFTEYVKKVHLNSPQIPIASTVTGAWVKPDEITNPSYWYKNLRQTVRFSDSLQALLKEPNRVLLEVGPGQTLRTLARQHSDSTNEHIVLSSIRHPNEKKSDSAFILNTLGWLHLAGIEVNWPAFYSNERRHRIPIPTYPFQRQRYWVESEKTAQITTSHSIVPSKKSDIGDWFYVPSWKRCDLLQPYDRRRLFEKKPCWLVFSSPCELGVALVERLQQNGQHVIAVKAGPEFCEYNHNAFTIDPQKEEDYSRLIQALQQSGQIPNKILHVWNLTTETESLREKGSLEISYDLGFISLLFLAKQIGDTMPYEQIDIKVMTNNLHDVTGEEELAPEKAAILGPCRVIPKEYSNVRCANVDVAFPYSNSKKEEDLLDLLVGELFAETRETVVAYRGRHRWVQIFEAIYLEKATDHKTRLRDGGVYLITGGLGGIGFTLAEFLSKIIQPKLVLIGRTIIPPRNTWEEWLKSHDEQDTISSKIGKIQALEKLGAQVVSFSADVSDLNQMEASIAQTYNQFGKINGVIHAAGIPGAGIIQRKTPEAAKDVLDPKVKGTLVLDKLLREADLDFFVLCSSVNSLRGVKGQVDYCAANSFLDAYAHKNYSRNNALSINWCMWQKVGMGVDIFMPEDMKQEREERIAIGILPAEGKEAFARILKSSFPQVIVSTEDLFNLMRQKIEKPLLDAEKKRETDFEAESKHARPDITSAYVVPENPTEHTIVKIWQQLLGIDKVGIYDNFFELGGHSILGTQLIENLRAEFGIKFPLAILYERPTVHSLSKMIIEGQQENIPSSEKSKSRGQRRRERKLRRE